MALDIPGTDFGIKDSGARESFDSGMVRDTEEGKIDYTLVFDGPMLRRWADHLTKGAKKYAPRNWMKATGEVEYDRFKRSLLRHLIAYLNGETDEDHAAAVVFNLNGMLYIEGQQSRLIGAGDFSARELTREEIARFAAQTTEQDASLDTYEDGTPRHIGLRLRQDIDGR